MRAYLRERGLANVFSSSIHRYAGEDLHKRHKSEL